MQNNAVDLIPNNVSFPFTQQADGVWVSAAHKLGFTTGQLTREECIQIHEKSGMRLPRWLMKCPSRRLARGVYALPELALYSANFKD